MGNRVLVLDAGSSAGNNLIRSLRAGDRSLLTIGCNESRFVLKKSAAHRNYVLPTLSENHTVALQRIIEAQRVDVVIPTNDGDITAYLRFATASDAEHSFLPGN